MLAELALIAGFGMLSPALRHGARIASVFRAAVPANHRSDRKLRAQKVAFEELIIPDEIHDLLRWSDWVRTYRVTAEFFDR